MANFEGVTASSGVKIKPDMLDEFQKLLDKHEIQPGSEFKGGYFNIYGYDWLEIYPIMKAEDGSDESDTDNPCVEEFLEAMRPFIPEGDHFEVQSIGNEKCRHPLSGWSAKVTPEKVITHFLGDYVEK